MIGAVFQGRYTVNGFLAEGPIFALYSARDKLTSKDVSLRVLKPPFDQEQSFKAALAEAISRTVTVRSAFVERLVDLETDQDKAFVVGELTRAPSLSDRMRKLAPFTPSVSVGFGVSIARGLEAFHKAGLAHGDISGDNIALLADGEVRLQLGGVWEAYSASATAGFMVLPTLAPYLAPEVGSGDLPSPSSDLYALGILLFELLTGRKPYQAETGLATAMRHSTEQTPRVRDQNPSIPLVLDEIVYKAMSKEPSTRYRTANELIFDLRQTQDALRFGRTLSWPISPATSAPQPPRKVQVAPKMSAAREPEPELRRGRREKPDRDVPVWMLVVLAGAFTAAAVLGIVDFLIGANRPRLVAVPNVAGFTVPEAKSSFKAVNLKLRVGQSAPNTQYAADRIISSDPAQETHVPENSTVEVLISQGPSQTAVPALKDLTPDKARQVLSELHLALDDQIDHVNDGSVKVGSICRQNPAAGAKVTRSTKIHVAISDSNAPVPSKNAKRYMYTLDVALTRIAQPVQVRIDMVDEQGSRTIFNEQKNPDDRFKVPARGVGDRATFIVYYDGREVDRKTQVAADASSDHTDGSSMPNSSSATSPDGTTPPTPPQTGDQTP